MEEGRLELELGSGSRDLDDEGEEVVVGRTSAKELVGEGKGMGMSRGEWGGSSQDRND